MTIASALLALLIATGSPASDSSGPALLDFSAEWCGPCRQTAPAVEQLIRSGYPVRKIDIDREPALRERYDVQAVPTFIVVDESGKRARSKVRPAIGRRARAVLQDGDCQGGTPG